MRNNFCAYIWRAYASEWSILEPILVLLRGFRLLLANCSWFSATSETLSYEHLEEGLIRERNSIPENGATKIPFLYCIFRPFSFTYIPSAFRPFFFDPPAFQEPSFWASRVSNLDQRPTRGSLRSLRQCRGRCNDLTPITECFSFIFLRLSLFQFG